EGVNLGAEDTTAPYSMSWNTATAVNGWHLLTAVARDTAGNAAISVPVLFKVSNPADTVPPTVAISAPSNGASLTGSVAVTATASDNVGVASVEFSVDGTPLGVDTTPPYSVSWDTGAATDGSHVLSTVARDATGNSASSSVVVTVANAATRVEDAEPPIAYTPGTAAPGRPAGWWHGSRSRDWSGRTASFNRSAGARATLSFVGTSVSWVGFRAPWAGIAKVHVDGAFVTEVDLFSLTEQTETSVFSVTGLTPGPHTLTVESTGRKHGGDSCAPGPDCASDYAVVVDAFDVAPAFAPAVASVRIEETTASYSAGWTQGDAGAAWSGGSAAISATPGAQAMFTFVGTSFSWIGRRGPRGGIARVHLDGAFQAEIDTYSPTEIHAVVYMASNLVAGRHTVNIEATGSRNMAATDAVVAVDAIDVGSLFQDTNASVVYSGAWGLENPDRPWSGASANTGAGTAAVSNTAGARATFTFSGTGVSWIGFREPIGGIAEVRLDNLLVPVDLYAAIPQVRVPVFTATGLPEGPHTLQIDVTGLRNGAAGGAFVVVDAFDVALPQSLPAVTRLQERDPSIAYEAPVSWTLGNRFKYWSGELAMSGATVGATATLSFTGTSVRWIGQRHFVGGVAHVRVDGMHVATVDTQVPPTSQALQEQYQRPMFSVTDLAPGPHTLVIEVTGRSGEPPGAAVEPVWIDAFDIY
ncbi:MAG TPA: Ig-like domain-containing protein, partial [Vicinamibacterales bacterium]|nr:Ig-like domain-containing protein [Vicinamibacterales bacterium]